MPDSIERVRFYGLNDHGTYFGVERVLDLLAKLDPAQAEWSINDVAELDQAALFIEHDVLPPRDDEASADWHSTRREIRRIVGTHFQQITDDTIGAAVHDIDFRYRTDLLRLLAQARAYERCSPEVAIRALVEAGLSCGDLLSSKALVKAYDEEVRTLVLGSPQNAELLVAKFFIDDNRQEIHLPSSLRAPDIRGLLAAYVAKPDANANFLQLIARARTSAETGVDDALKLQAQRAYDTFWDRHFETNDGIRTGCEVSVSDDQEEPVLQSIDGLFVKYSYSRAYLQSTLDYPSILNNFQNLFGFAHGDALLSLPSYYADLGIVDRFLKTSGREDYLTGEAFDHTNIATLLQTAIYHRFLRAEGIELEQVIEWFFADYLREEFNAECLRFTPSSLTASYLEKCRHLFAELERVLRQFRLFAENGELDFDLLAMSSESLDYVKLPSLVPEKYAYQAPEQPDIARILHVLFSDQSSMTYISDQLRGENLADLILHNDVSYQDFHEYQRPALDALIADELLLTDDGALKFASGAQFNALFELFKLEAISVGHLTAAGRRAVDAMVERGWLQCTSTLLTKAESAYFNYFLNHAQFTNGPALRNRYLHGAQMESDDDRVHIDTYVTALRLLVALVIKLNDDFELASAESDE